MFRYCLARTGGDDDAEELMSEVFVRTLAALPRYEGGPFVSFLYRVARGAKLAHAGRQSGSSPGADRQTSRSVQRRALITALSRLKADCRDVLLLCFVEGHDPVETARLLGKTETAVQNLRRRGLESLRRELSKRHEADFFEATA